MSGKSQVPVAAPKTLRYEQDAGLPVAIDAKSSRHFHTPINGQVFKPEGTNQIRIHINSDNFVDFSHATVATLQQLSLQSVAAYLARLEGRCRALVCSIWVVGRRDTCLRVDALAWAF